MRNVTRALQPQSALFHGTIAAAHFCLVSCLNKWRKQTMESFYSSKLIIKDINGDLPISQIEYCFSSTRYILKLKHTT